MSQVQSTIYDSAQSYFSSLNEDSWWINYNHRSMSVSVSSLRDFVLHMRPAAPEAAPFDRPDRSSRANQLFGIGEESTLHFSSCVAQTVAAGAEGYAACDGWDEEYETAWVEDLEKVDALETDMAGRVAMMEPLTWLSGHYDAYGQSTVAPHWRVNEGLFDTEAPLVTASNIVYALRKYDDMVRKACALLPETRTQIALSKLKPWLETQIVENEDAGKPGERGIPQGALRLREPRTITWAFIAWNVD